MGIPHIWKEEEIVFLLAVFIDCRFEVSKLPLTIFDGEVER